MIRCCLSIVRGKVGSQPEADSMVGYDRTLGFTDLQLGMTLGAGSFGTVKFAVARERAPVAVKVMHKSLFVRKTNLRQVLSERRVMKHIYGHPFIVKLFGSFQDEKHLYLIMEFLQGGEFFNYIKIHKSLSPEHTRFYVSQVVACFDYLHNLDVIYRDLKPENLMISADGYLKLIDYSFAKMLMTNGKTYTLCGTPVYLAPEVIQCRGHGKGVDWWTLGIFTYELLVGSTPFVVEGNVMNLYEKILNSSVLFPRTVPKDARSFIKSLCERDLTRRLGCIRTETAGVKKHKYFSRVSFSDLLKKRSSAPFKPTLSGPQDFSNFAADYDFNNLLGLKCKQNAAWSLDHFSAWDD